MSRPASKSKSEGYRQMRDVQRAFASAVMRPLTSDYGMQPAAADGGPTATVVEGFIKPNDRLSSFERLEIYNKQYWFRLLDSLYEDFPGLRSLMGDDRFHAMSIAYLEKYPSRSFTLRDLGDRLGLFLARNPQWVTPQEKLARDLVRLEWAHIVAFDGDELPPVDVNTLLDGSRDPAQLRLKLQPYLTVLACDYPVDDYILEVRRHAEQRGEASNAVAEHLPRRKGRKLMPPQPARTHLIVHRSENAVWYKPLEPEAYRLLAALQKGVPLQVACERAAGDGRQAESFAAKLPNWFAQWAAFGWICGVE